MQNKKGFTIIELLVVIAIIAVLAAVVLVNVTGYINKGKDAAAKGNLATLLINGALYYDDSTLGSGNYLAGSTGGFNNSISWKKVSNALSNAGYTTITSTQNSSNWCASVVLKTNNLNSYCVDSSGNKKEAATASATCASFVCP